MKRVLSLLVGVAFVGGLATAGFAGGDKSGASASGTMSGSGSVSTSPSTGGQDKVSGQDAPKSGQDSGASASPATGGQDKSGAASTESAPLSKDECMNDGWQKFGDRFKDQGDCVSSITSNSDKKQ